jgi:uncharacterized protein (TIGR00255 family)
MQSMTGYGIGHARSKDAQVVVEARAVNHRFLELRARAAATLGEHSVLLEEIGRARGQRGRIEITARIEGTLGGPVRLDVERAASALHDLQALSLRLGRSETIPLALLASVPDLFVSDAGISSDDLRDAMRDAASRAFDQLESMRKAEGAALGRDLTVRLQRIGKLCADVLARSDDAVDAARDRLKARIERLLRGTGVALDPGRLEHEVAVLAERADIAEELTRLQSHVDQLADLLKIDSEPIGRRIEFLLQEMGREVNTLGSKTADLEITALVLSLKAELERLREQAQNVL